jgi:lipocalin
VSLKVHGIRFSVVLLVTNKRVSVKVVNEKKDTDKDDLSTVLGTVDVHDGDHGELFVYLYLPFSVAAHITVQSQQGAIAIAIRSPSKASTYTSTATTPSHGIFKFFICHQI